MHVALQTGRLDVTTAAASARNREVARRKRQQLAAVHMSRASENCILNVDDRFRLRYFDARPRRSTLNERSTFAIRRWIADTRPLTWPRVNDGVPSLAAPTKVSTWPAGVPQGIGGVSLCVWSGVKSSHCRGSASAHTTVC